MKVLFIIILISSAAYGQSIGTMLSLDEAVSTALKKNFEIFRSQKSVDAAKGRFWSDISLQQPEISVSHEFVPIGKGLRDFQEKTIEINQSIEFPTNLFLKGSRASYEIDATMNDRDKMIVEISSNVKKLYREVLIKGKKYKLAEENLKIAKEFLNKAELRLKAGEGTKLESITAKIQLNEANTTLESIKNELLHSKNELITILNTNEFTADNLVLSDSISFMPIELNHDELLNYAIANNYILKKSGNLLEIAAINKALAWSGLLPNLNFSYYRQSLPESNNFYGLSFGISVPVWFFFDQKGKIQEASANYNIAEEERKSVKKSVEINLRNAYSSFSYEQGQIKLYINELLQQAEEVFNLAKVSYNAGEINYVEFLQAKQTLISVNNNYYNSLSNYYSSLSELEKAVCKLIR